MEIKKRMLSTLQVLKKKNYKQIYHIFIFYKFRLIKDKKKF